ncbi:hypothetical protein Tchar_00099 [Tepidimonas charontis]|uniref:Uncharacterized protein n=1 Tax=Tepidimonas charontis TaxID=2267262 RepID=A0A554XKW6_9BURK|nr:hypothetical protein Tchar_00099 [Tepidimonas charontis]
MRPFGSSPTAQRLWAMFVAGVAAVNFPLLALWATWAQQWGAAAPFVVALFAVWAVLIAALAWIVERAPD